MFSTRNSYNVDTETAQWQRLYRSIEENVRRELMEEVDEQLNKLKRKNRKLKDQNQCLMEMVAMMRTSSTNSTAFVQRFVPQTPPLEEGMITPIVMEPSAAEKPSAHTKTDALSIDLTNISESDIVLEPVFIKIEKPEKTEVRSEVKHILVPDLPYENLAYCADCHKNICICEAEPEEQEEQGEAEQQDEVEQQQSEVEEQHDEQQEEEEVETEEEQEVETEEQQEEEQQGEAEQEVETEEQGEAEQQGEAEPEQQEVETEQQDEVEEQDEVEQSEVEEQQDEEEQSEEESVEEVTIQGKRYYATNTKNGDIYDIDEDENPGEVVGKYVNGVPEFISQAEEQGEEEQEEQGEEEEQQEEQQEEEEESVEEVTIQGKRYYVTNTRDGLIYSVMDDDDVGPEVGKYVNGKPVFNK